MISFLNRHNILFNNQFGFRSGHSTSMALTFLIDKITAAMDRKEHFLGLFIDLSKAFDTVNNSILMYKLEYYSIRGVALNLLKSYLRNRTQYVEFNHKTSEILNISCGVPQGSILGPLLFLLYVNDLPNISQSLCFLMYADDTNIFMSNKCIKQLQTDMNYNIKKLVTWMNVNRLSLNVSKTHCMLFSKKYKLRDLDVKITGTNVECVKQTKFLGVMLDEKLTWKAHVDNVVNKMAKLAGLFNKLRFKNKERNIYHTL